MASRRGQALFHAHGLGQAVRVSRETTGKPKAGRKNSPPPLGKVACPWQAGEGRHSFSRPQLKASQAAFHVKQTGKPMQGAETRLPLWGRWLAIGKPRGQALFPAHSLRQAMRDSRETNRHPTAGWRNSPLPLGEVACHRKAGEGRNPPTRDIQAHLSKKANLFSLSPGSTSFRPALWYNVQRTQRARHSLCGRIASPGSERTGPRE